MIIGGKLMMFAPKIDTGTLCPKLVKDPQVKENGMEELPSKLQKTCGI